MAFRFRHRLIGLVFALACVLVAALVIKAALTRIAGPATVANEPRLFVGLDGAFDSINNVYLVVWGTQGPGPLNGLFLDVNGSALGGVFPISPGPEQAGWGSVVYSPEQQRFLVSYTRILGPSLHQRAFRMLAYNGAGGPAFLTGEVPLATFGRAFGDAPGVAYSPAAGVFLATWHHDDDISPANGDHRPRSFVAPISPAGAVLGVQLLTHPDDGQSDPQIACNPSGRCLVIGFAWGAFAGATSSVWGRYIDGAGATPLGLSSFYVASAPAQFEPAIVYSGAAGQWLVAFTRDLKSVWGRMLDANGSMGPISLLKESAGEASPDGGGFGLPSLSYNTTTNTMFLAMGSWAGLACAQELTSTGALIGTTDCVPGPLTGTHYTGSVADKNSPRFLMIDNQEFNKVRSTAYAITGGGGGVPASISGEPASQTILAGTSAVLTVTASGSAPITYQWYEGDSPNGAVPIPGANASSYATPALQTSKRYWVQVANAFGTDNSNTAFVTASHIANGGFWGNSMSGWSLFATPDLNYIQWGVGNDVLHFYRVPPPSGTNQATVFQQTGAAFASNMGLRAIFQLGNSSSVRKRISVLLTDADFSDLSVCTFWLAPNSPLQTYSMLSHTTEAWSNASIYFYAATAGSDGGAYMLDNVILEQDPTLPSGRTDCSDPQAPAPVLLPHSNNLIANPAFDTGTIPPWIAFGSLVHQVSAGVVEMYQPAGPAGSLLQMTGTPMAANDILSAAFSLGNTSGVRKRVTVILHDSDFSDLSACSFWLQPGAPLQTYAMTTYATDAWSNATLSIYVATQGNHQWVQFDNVFLQRAPTVATVGTECMEPGAVPGTLLSAAGAAASTNGSTRSKSAHAPAPAVGSAASGRAAAPVASTPAVDVLEPAHRTDWIETLDLRMASAAMLSFESSLSMAGASSAEIQVSEDGITWQTLAQVPASDDWITLNVDLSAWAGRVVQVRFAFDARAPLRGGRPDTWLIGDVRVVK
jgi:hypothetical protein